MQQSSIRVPVRTEAIGRLTMFTSLSLTAVASPVLYRWILGLVKTKLRIMIEGVEHKLEYFPTIFEPPQVRQHLVATVSLDNPAFGSTTCALALGVSTPVCASLAVAACTFLLEAESALLEHRLCVQWPIVAHELSAYLAWSQPRDLNPTCYPCLSVSVSVAVFCVCVLSLSLSLCLCNCCLDAITSG